MLITLIKIRKSENTIRFNETGWNHREKRNHKENSDTDCMLVSKDTNEKLGENKYLSVYDVENCRRRFV